MASPEELVHTSPPTFRFRCKLGAIPGAMLPLVG